MSLSKHANGNFKRLTTGPLYSARDLRQTLEFLAADGFAKVEDNHTLGFSHYARTVDGKKTGDAVLYLDSVGCNDLCSGMMILSGDGQQANCTTIWDYAKQKRIESAKNPVMRLVRHFF